MNWADWVPAITSSTVLGALSFAVGTYYRARVERGVQHDLDKKLEAVRSELRREEERHKIELRTRDDQISALRSGALSGLASRQAALDKRRIEAAERLWAIVVELGKLKFVAQMVGAMKMDAVLETAAGQGADSRKLREFGDTVWKIAAPEAPISSSDADKERPFIQPLVWALFAAYRQVLFHPMGQLAALRTGAGPKMIKDDEVIGLVKKALPHMAEYMDKFGTGALYLLVPQLEEKLLSTLISDLSDPRTDDATLNQAAEILRASDELAAKMRVVPTLPDVAGIQK